MIEFYKNRGETPLDALNRFRIQNPQYTDAILSYAGRLDPMAEGILPILIGEEENKNRKEFLHKNKIYKAFFLIGYCTDTGDVLGLIQKDSIKHINEKNIVKACEELSKITEQVYPWYSSKTVDGVSLFEYARKGDFSIVRPIKDITIYSVNNIKVETIDSKIIIKEIIEDIKKVKGDFRQEDIIKKWNLVLEKNKNTELQLVSIILTVSSGTYIRGLCEVLEEKLGVPIVLYKLIRTDVL